MLGLCYTQFSVYFNIFSTLNLRTPLVQRVLSANWTCPLFGKSTLLTYFWLKNDHLLL